MNPRDVTQPSNPPGPCSHPGCVVKKTRYLLNGVRYCGYHVRKNRPSLRGNRNPLCNKGSKT